MVKVLLPIQVWEAKFDLCLIELRTLLHQPDIDYDKDAIVIELFMKLGVFAWYEMIPKDAALLCNLSNVVVMKTQLNLTQNRTFLGMFIEIFSGYDFIKRSYNISSLQPNHFGKQLYQSL